MSTLFAALLASAPVLAGATWPSERPAEGLSEILAQTSPVELGPMDCTPASGVIAARLLELPISASTVDAVDALRRQGSWPTGAIGMPLSRLATALERHGGVVSRIEDGWLSSFAGAISRGGVAIVCGRNGAGELHAVALSGYDFSRDAWTVHDPDRAEPLVVSSADLRRFRKERCEDRLDLVVMPRGSKRFRPAKGRGKLVRAGRSRGGRRAAAGGRAGGSRGGGGSGEGARPEVPPLPVGSLGLGLGLTGGLLILGVVALGVRRGWFDKHKGAPVTGGEPGGEDEPTET